MIEINQQLQLTLNAKNPHEYDITKSIASSELVRIALSKLPEFHGLKRNLLMVFIEPDLDIYICDVHTLENIYMIEIVAHGKFDTEFIKLRPQVVQDLPDPIIKTQTQVVADLLNVQVKIADNIRAEWRQRFKELTKIRNVLHNSTWKIKLKPLVFEEKLTIIQPAVDEIKEKEIEKLKSKNRMKLQNSINNEEVMALKCAKGKKDILEPICSQYKDKHDKSNLVEIPENQILMANNDSIPNEQEERNNNKKRNQKRTPKKTINKNKLIRQSEITENKFDIDSSPLSSPHASDNSESVEDRGKEVGTPIGDEHMSETNMQERMSLWETEMFNERPRSISRIYKEDYKKIKCGLKQVLDQCYCIFDGIN
jgi:hypothetical protein